MRVAAARRPVNTCVLAALLAATLSFGLPPAFATPSTPRIEEKRAEAQAARAEMDELAARAELAHEDLAQIAEALERTREQISETREALAAARREQAAAQAALEDRAAGIYRSGRVQVLEVLLGTTSFGDFLTRVEWLRRLNRSDAVLVLAVKQAVDEVETAERALERREEEQVVLRRQSEVKAREVDEALARQERFVNTLDGEVASLVAEEEERLRREAEERARRAAEEAARRAAEEAARRAAEEAARRTAATPSPGTPGIPAGGGGTQSPSAPVPAAYPDGRVFDSAAVGAGRPEAVTTGMKYLGVPYVWGGSTPSGFDCSGLTQYVYREIGVSIPRTSRTQFTVGAFVPPDRMDLLLPGDLVFFGYDGDPSRIHHVGIYVGNGDYLHAPSAGRPVQVESLTSRIARRADFVGATRP